MKTDALSHSRALWNRSHLDLRSLEILAQILDRGELQDWRELYALARDDQELRARMATVVRTVPLAFGPFWRAALRSLGDSIDSNETLPEYRGEY